MADSTPDPNPKTVPFEKKAFIESFQKGYKDGFRAARQVYAPPKQTKPAGRPNVPEVSDE